MIYIAVLILLISVFLLSIYMKERFESAATSTPKVYTTNKLNHTTWLDNMTSIPLSSVDSIYTHVAKNSSFPQPIQNNSMWVASPIERDLFLSSMKGPIKSVTGYYVALGLPAPMFAQECAFDWFNKRIGYIDWCDRYLVKSIMRGYRIPDDSTTVVPVPMEQWDNLVDYMVKNKVDIIVAFVIPESGFHQLLLRQQLSVVGWGKLDIDRIKVFHPYVSVAKIDVKKIIVHGDTSSLMVMDREKYGPLLAMDMGTYAVSSSSTENFVSRLEISPETLDPTYRCYGELTLETKALCESPFDPSGEPKKKRTIWDRPCIKNEDCPFYKANRNYANTRGGCLKGGVCEMPVGVLRTAFRTYDDKGQRGEFKPFCYQCTDSSDVDCCKKQYMPDYAFANDYEERKRSKVPTFVSAV